MTTIDILKKTRAARGELAVLDEAGKTPCCCPWPTVFCPMRALFWRKMKPT